MWNFFVPNFYLHNIVTFSEVMKIKTNKYFPSCVSLVHKKECLEFVNLKNKPNGKV